MVQNDITAFNAFRLSWQVTNKRQVAVALNWISIFLLSVIISAIVLTAADYLFSAADNVYVQVAVNALLLIFVLPLFVGYSVEIAKRLEQ